MTLLLEKSATAAPLELTITKNGSGLTGLAPVVRLRDASTVNSYFDFADGTFKTNGWGMQDAPLGEIGRGHYQKSINVAATASLVPGMILIAEYHVDNGIIVGDESDTIGIVRVQQDTTLLRKHLTNRLEEVSGNPGQITLYDDDAATPLLRWPLHDEFGQAVTPQAGTPAQRGAGS